MTTNTNAKNEAAAANDAPRQPTHIAKTRHGWGKNKSYERVGVAWVNDNGSIYVKLHGTQVVSNFMLYAVDQEQDQAYDQAGD